MEVAVAVGWPAPPSPPPMTPAVPSPEAVGSSVDEALVVKVEVLGPPMLDVESEIESHVEEREESTEDVTLLVPDESWLVKVAVVETDVEEEFVEVRNARGWSAKFVRRGKRKARGDHVQIVEFD